MRIVSMKVLAVGVPLTVLAATGAAVAYWTGGGGTGGGNAGTAATGSTSLTVTQASAPTTMAPGVTTGPISVTVSNPGSSSVYAAQVVVSIASVTKAASAPAGTCSAADYTLSGETMTTGAANLAPAGTTTFTGASLVFNDTTANQDACKGATVGLTYVAS